MTDPLSRESDQQVCCACLHVVYARRLHADGLCSDRWECRDCGTEFGRLARLHAENAKLRERVANLMVAIAPLRIDLPCKCDDDGECQYHAEMLHEVVLAARAALAACDEEP